MLYSSHATSCRAVPPPAYHRACARQAGLHIDAVTLVTTLHLLALCQVAVRLAQLSLSAPVACRAKRRATPLQRASLLLIALLRTLWRLSSQDIHDWLRAWPAPAHHPRPLLRGYRVSLLSPPASSALRMVGHRDSGRFDLFGF